MVWLAGGYHEDGTLPKLLVDPNAQVHLQRINLALESLKTQHAALLCSLHGDAATTIGKSSPFSATAEENPEELLPVSRFSTAFTRRSKIASSVSSLSDGAPVEWFDAQDNVGEEFVLEDPTPDEEKGPPNLQSGSSSYNEYESSSSEDEETTPYRFKTALDAELLARQITRRTRLPSGPVGDEGSLFTVLKKNVGKVRCFFTRHHRSGIQAQDLSTIAFPVSFNEPLTMLQRAAEEMEYHDLLRQAVNSKDPVERMCFVAAFAVSSYAHTRHRTGRKGL